MGHPTPQNLGLGLKSKERGRIGTGHKTNSSYILKLIMLRIVVDLDTLAGFGVQVVVD